MPAGKDINMINSNVYDYVNVLDKAADAAWLRNNAIANNIANDDTPGYKRQDVDFEGALRKALQNNRYVSVDDKISALNENLSALNVSTYTDNAGYSYRLDGNNVDMETESAELAENYIKYQAIMKGINQEFTNLQTVLK